MDVIAPLSAIERGRLRSAAGRGRVMYPGPVGEFLALELDAWEQAGFHFSGNGLIKRLVDHLLTARIPDKAANTTTT